MTESLEDGVGKDRIDAMPTKQVFIDMLTRDIALTPAIIDLVDNSADGARLLRGEQSYEGLWSRIRLSPTEFEIADNCGGIPIEVAEKYAFRFGRAEGAPSVPHSIGEFGIGMKRAIFKLGKSFRVESATAASRFVVEENVLDWAKKEQWRFSFDELEEGIEVDEEHRGTVVRVRDLHPEVAKELRLEKFRSRLREELRSRLQEPISRGLAVVLDGIPVQADPLELISDDRLSPAYHEEIFEEEGEAPVGAKFFAGLGPRSSDAGWHVFCNGRLVLEAEKTEVTGWGTEDEGYITRFHGEYNYFRGYVYFDSDDPGRLPWNSTKTGLDLDSPIYKASRQRMRTMMGPVVAFMRKLAREKRASEEEGPGPLTAMLEEAPTDPVDEIQTREIFESPEVPPPASPKPETQRIQYERPKEQAELVKRHLKVTSWKKVGERTFDYYFAAEVNDG